MRLFWRRSVRGNNKNSQHIQLKNQKKFFIKKPSQMEYNVIFVTILTTRILSYEGEKTMTNAITTAPATKKTFFGTRSKRLTREDMEIVEALETVRSDMEFLHNCFDNTTDAILVESLVYELKAANLKYKYYLNLCKQKGIVHGGA